MLRAGAACHLGALNHVLVQTASATIEDGTHDIQRIRILVLEANGVVADLHLWLRFSFSDHAHLCALLWFKRHHWWRCNFAWLQSAEIGTDGLLSGGWIKVTHNDANKIVGAVVGVPVLHRLVHAVTVEVTGPADHRPRIWAGHPEHAVELLLKYASWRAFRAQAALFVHHIALAVELAEHAVVEAIALHPGPQLKLIAGHIDEVESEVVTGEGIHARATSCRVDLVELILDDRRQRGLLRLEVGNLLL